MTPFTLPAVNAGPLFQRDKNQEKSKGQMSTEMVLRPTIVTNSDYKDGVSGDFVFSELIRQIPNLTGTEARPLSQMITAQLGRWKRSAWLTFRRTKIVEKISKASVTIIDFECIPFNSRQSLDARYASTTVMSDIINPETPSEQISCLWAPAYDGKETLTYRKESTHLLSVIRQFWEGCTYNERLRTSVAATAIHNLFSKHFTEWTPNFTSEDAALQRALAWGVVAANTSQIEYRLFAASLVALLNSQINLSLTDGPLEMDNFGNDICYTLTPHFKIHDIELGRYRLCGSAQGRRWK